MKVEALKTDLFEQSVLKLCSEIALQNKALLHHCLLVEIKRGLNPTRIPWEVEQN